eukprot:6626-Pelagococcus_subviridis.AAC.2
MTWTIVRSRGARTAFDANLVHGAEPKQSQLPSVPVQREQTLAERQRGRQDVRAAEQPRPVLRERHADALGRRRRRRPFKRGSRVIAKRRRGGVRRRGWGEERQNAGRESPRPESSRNGVYHKLRDAPKLSDNV